MSARRDVEERLALYGELSAIMTAMKNMARVELHRVERRALLQERCRTDAVRAARVLHGLCDDPWTGNDTASTFVCIGSERGFCGAFNETIASYARPRAASAKSPRLIGVGGRLSALLDVPREDRIEGATTASEAVAVLDAVVELCSLSEGGGTASLHVIYHGAHGAEDLQVVPVPPREADTPGRLSAFRMNEQPRAIAAAVQRQYIHHTLLALLYESLRNENRMRLGQMEVALRHLDESRDTLQRRRNALRQEEIVQEIETIFLSPTLSGRGDSPDASKSPPWRGR